VSLDFTALSQLICEIYDAALDPILWKLALQHSCAFVGGDSAALFWHDAASERSAALHLYNDDPYYTQLYFDKYVPLDPMFPATAIQPTGVVHSSLDIVPWDELVQTRFYKEWMQPQRLIEAVGGNLEKTATSSALLAIRFTEDNGFVTDEVRHRFGLILPHFQRAVAIGRLFDQGKEVQSMLTQTLDHVEAGVFLVAANGQIVFVNAVGQTMLDEGTKLRQRNRGLAAVVPEAQRMLREIFQAAESGDASIDARSVAVPLSDSADNRWFAHVLPLTSGHRQSAGSMYAAVAAVFVRNMSPGGATPLEMLAKKYKLTASEIRVLDAVVKVGSVRAIAEMRGISEATVKTHLQHVFRKTGTGRQSDLIKLVAGMGI
jgi:DNA-binding CsgD family transcriptional regulator